MPIITGEQLASYLDVALTDNITLKANLADGIVAELIYPTGTLPETIPARVTAITLEVGARAVRNTDGYSSETIDDYTYRRPDGTREAGIYLTAGEKRELRGIADGSTQRSVRLTSALTRITP